MNPISLKLRAHLPSGAAWAFFVADEASGLKLPIVRDEFAIKVSRDCIVLDCELDLSLRYDKFLELRLEDGALVCEQGFLVLLEPAHDGVHRDKQIVNCIVMLDGFSGKEAE